MKDCIKKLQEDYHLLLIVFLLYVIVEETYSLVVGIITHDSFGAIF